MTEAQLQQLFRQKIKVVPGGPPVGTVGSNRSAGLIAVLDALAKEIKNGGGGAGTGTLTLVAAQARINAAQVALNPFYAISGTWNTAATPITATVYVQSLNATTYAPTGWAFDANDELQLVKVNVAAGTVDTEELRGLWMVQYGEIDPNTREVPVWFGPAATPSATARVVVAP